MPRLTLRELLACNFEYLIAWLGAVGGAYGVVVFLHFESDEAAALCAVVMVLAFFGVYRFEQEHLDRADRINAALREQHKQAQGD